MGVHGLWRLIDASGKPVPLETLEGKVLAIDISIWIHQVLQGYQDHRGNSLPNAHLLGLFHRICKLLYFKIQPVFVFDGGVPMLKKNTIASRRKQKAIATTKSQQMKSDLIQNLIKNAIVKSALRKGDKDGSSQGSSSVDRQLRSSEDMFKLPNLPIENNSLSEEADDDYDDYDSDDSVELSPRKQLRWVGNIHTVDVNSSDFKALPADVRYDILTDLKETRKQNSWGRLHEMPGEYNRFSNYQMERLLKRRQVQESLETAEKEMGGKTMTLEELEKLMTDQGIDTKSRDSAFRIASDCQTRLIYINNPTSQTETTDTTELVNSQISAPDSLSSDREVSRGSENSEPSMMNAKAESVIENINEYTFDSDWESEEEIIATKGVEPSPLFKTKMFGKERCNPALAYMLEHTGLSQEQILALIKGDKQVNKRRKSLESEEKDDERKTAEEIIPLSFPDTQSTSASKEYSEVGTSNEVGTATPDVVLVDPTETCDTSSSVIETSSLCNESREDAFCKPSKADNSICLANPTSSDSDTDSDFVEIPDIPIPDYNFGLGASVKSEQTLKVEEDIFADIFEKPETSISDADVQELSSSFNSATDTSNRETDNSLATIELTPKEKDQIPVMISEKLQKESTVPTEMCEIGAETSKDPIPVEIIPKPSTSHAQDLSEVVAKVKPESLLANPEKLATIQAKLDGEYSELSENIAKLERQATAVTDQMRIEAEHLLKLFGIPYIIAPMEAEAQCAYLESIGLTDGTITDDSDIWLFGGRCVYKNFFNNNKRVMQYQLSDIQHHFKLKREQMIQLALLVGSDYTVGVTGIGPVTALEVLAAFPSQGDNLLNGLTMFSSWIKTGRSAGPGRTSLRSKLRNVVIDRGFPSQAVVQAYLFPTVDESKESFTWTKPNIQLLADYTRDKFGWTRIKFEEIIAPVVKRLAESKSQKSIASYFRVKTVPKSIETNMSKRVKKAVERLGNPNVDDKCDQDTSSEVQQNEDQQTSNDSERPKGKNKSKPSKTKAVKTTLSTVPEAEDNSRKCDVQPVGSKVVVSTTTEVAKGSAATTFVQRNGKNVEEYIPQREKDKANALKKKLHAIEVFRKSMKGPVRTKKAKRVVQNVKKEANLSESSDSS